MSRRGKISSASPRCLVVGRQRPSAARSPGLREETARGLTETCVDCPWVDSLCTFERWSYYIAFPYVSIFRICRSYSSGNVRYTTMFSLLLARDKSSGLSKALAWRKLWRQTLHRLHTCGFTVKYYKGLCCAYSGKIHLHFGDFSCLFYDGRYWSPSTKTYGVSLQEVTVFTHTHTHTYTNTHTHTHTKLFKLQVSIRIKTSV